MTIAHTGITISADKARAVVAWYEAALGPLGYSVFSSMMDGAVVGFADADSRPDWWVIGRPDCSPPTSHHAFLAKDRATVDAFHAAAVVAGGECNGKPGPRPMYGPTYYAAYVKDPAGNNVEAVCFAPEA